MPHRFYTTAYLILSTLFPGTLLAQWQQGGIETLDIHAVLAHGAELFAGSQTAGCYRSTDGGTTWTAINNGLAQVFLRAFYHDGTTLFAGTNGPVGAYRTTNSGGLWTAAGATVGNGSVHALTAHGATLLAGTNGTGIYRSTDGGTSWSAFGTGLTNLNVHALLVTGTRVYAGCGLSASDSGLFISTDGGSTWTLPADGPNNVRCLAALGTTIIAGTSGLGLYRSTDEGMTWSQVVSTPLALIRALQVVGGTVFAGGQGGVIRSTDAGASWTAINDGLTNTNVLSLGASATTLYAGTIAGGVWQRPLSDVTGVSGASETPRIFTLQQNFPNPFNPATTISFSLPEEGHVTLDVYNLLGGHIATLLDVDQPGGTHTASWSADGVAGGVYFYRLTFTSRAGSSVSVGTRSMILLR